MKVRRVTEMDAKRVAEVGQDIGSSRDRLGEWQKWRLGDWQKKDY
jgi:hypothetical protein